MCLSLIIFSFLCDFNVTLFCLFLLDTCTEVKTVKAMDRLRYLIVIEFHAIVLLLWIYKHIMLKQYTIENSN